MTQTFPLSLHLPLGERASVRGSHINYASSAKERNVLELLFRSEGVTLLTGDH